MRFHGRGAGKNLALAAAGLAVTVVVAEVVLRTTHLAGARPAWTEPDSLIGWRFTPGRPYWFNKENDHPITGRINAHGWRDVDRAVHKPAGVYRVAVLGDSFVEAFQVELDSTFAAIAERELNAAGVGPVELLNFGRSGMTQTEELLVLERNVRAYAPDLVVVVFVPLNDIDDVEPDTADEPARPYFRVDAGGDLVLDTSFNRGAAFRLRRRVNWIKQRSALVSLLLQRVNLMRRRGRIPEPEEAPRITDWRTLCTGAPAPAYVRKYELNKRLIARMHSDCDDGGADFLLMVVQGEYRDHDVAELQRVDPTYEPGFFSRDLCAWAERLGMSCLGLHQPFAEAYRERGEPLHWGHWNYAGHRVVAAELAQWIRREREARGP